MLLRLLCAPLRSVSSGPGAKETPPACPTSNEIPMSFQTQQGLKRTSRPGRSASLLVFGGCFSPVHQALLASGRAAPVPPPPGSRFPLGDPLGAQLGATSALTEGGGGELPVRRARDSHLEEVFEFGVDFHRLHRHDARALLACLQFGPLAFFVEFSSVLHGLISSKG